MKTRAKVLDISKALVQAWHKRRIYKGLIYGFTEKLLTLLSDFLSNRKQSSFKWPTFLKGRH